VSLVLLNEYPLGGQETQGNSSVFCQSAFHRSNSKADHTTRTAVILRYASYVKRVFVRLGVECQSFHARINIYHDVKVFFEGIS
jgi:hypothetical protein